MRLAVISDIHSNMVGLKWAVRDATKNGAEKIVFLGDYITDGDGANEIVDYVREYGDYIINGNREKYMFEFDAKRAEYENYKPILYTYNSLSESTLSYLKNLPFVIEKEENGYKLLIIHGDAYLNGRKSLEEVYDAIIDEYDFDICLYGHSHRVHYEEYQGHYFINPGTVGVPSEANYYSYALVDLDSELRVTIRECSTREKFSKLESEYVNSPYYKENPIWASLIITGIKDGKNYSYEFAKSVDSKLSGDIPADEFNRIWVETYEEFWDKIKAVK